MLNTNSSAKNCALVAPFLIMSLTSHLANADIFKWKDNHGVTQYSDSPPTSGLVKASSNEVVNALQKKDLCAEPVAKKLVNFTASESINFFNTSFQGQGSNGSGVNANRNATQPRTNKPFSAVARSNALKASAVSNGISARNSNFPFKNLNQNSIFNFDNQKVNIFNASFKVKNNASPIINAAPVITAPVILAALPTSSGVTIPSSGQPAPVTTTPVTSSTTPTSSSSIPVSSTTPATTPTTTTTTTTTPTGSGIVQKDLMPAVNIAKNMAPVPGWTDLRIRPNMGDWDIPPVGDGWGQFRIDCAVSHMSNDDPLVYPNQQGAAHHHTFFGNTSINYKTNLATLSTTGNSTCRGGTANRSAYWVPSMIDSATGTPLKPYSSLWYYKTGYSIPKEKITAPPKGLRIVTGNMKATSAATSRNISFTCFKEGSASPPATAYIPACPQSWTIVTHVGFPQCWDGKNLDSPDHISHMANPIGNSCPTSHPVAIPNLGLNVKYLITDAEGTKNWRLSSDNYAKNGYNSGFSSHADWVNGWDEKVIAGVVKNCLNAGKDCGNHMLGDGTVIFAENVGTR